METIKTIPNEIREKLRAPLPKESISQHGAKSFLSSIKAIYIVERLNDVFGIGGWKVRNEVIQREGVWVVMKATVLLPAYNIEIEQFGGNDNSDLGDAYKGAATDALTKIASYLEIGIQVYKGLTDKPRPNDNKPWLTNKTNPSDNKPWLTEEQFNNALIWIKEGKHKEIQEKIKGYRMRKIFEERLQIEIGNKLLEKTI